MSSQPSFNPSCPSGGTWYACGNGPKFTGCCGKDPCNDNGCPAGLLYPAAFDISKYGSFPDQECNAGLWYTCIFKNQYPDSFMGCCSINPCANKGCPTESLAGGYLSGNPVTAQQFDPFPPLPAAANTTSSSVTSSTSTSTATAAAASATHGSNDKVSVPVGAIAGAAAGGVLLLCAIAFLIWRFKYHSRRSSRAHNKDSTSFVNTYHDPGAYQSQILEKSVFSDVRPVHSYQDSPSPVPVYSGQHSPDPRYTGQGPNPQMVRDGYFVQEAETRSAFKPYSPQAGPASQSSPHGSTSQYMSPVTQSSGRTPTTSWGNVPGRVTTVSRKPLTNSQGYEAPVELPGADVTSPLMGLGVHGVRDDDFSDRSRTELDARSGGLC